ncbi:MAG: hypothetical protein GW876_00255 [Bacteroidetes bacterium]|nr:hypothetical protein [Bacteroidota bacterium]
MYLTKRITILLLLSVIFAAGCKKEKDETPTKTKMEGVWVVKEAHDSTGVDILSKFQNHLLPVTVFYFSSDNTVLSTAGPLTTYLVYGDSKFMQITSTINQWFNYANLTFNGGEFFVADGTPDRFALEMKLEGVGGGVTNTLAEILQLFNIEDQWLKTVVYHKFINVGVSFNETNTQMTWVWDDQTTARYNMKNQYGDYVLWGGWPINKFSKCRFVLEKKSKSLNDVTTEAYQNPPTKILIPENK